ncbi:MAG TPA: rhodanese-like domain-containing protein [Ignavibacteria bacterium]
MSFFENIFSRNTDSSDIDVQQFDDLMKNNENIILDVRTENEFKDSRIKGSINIDYHNSNFLNKVSELDRYKTILIYCRSGNRSHHAMQKMKKMGFQNPLNLTGGIIAWTKSNKPIIK